VPEILAEQAQRVATTRVSKMMRRRRRIRREEAEVVVAMLTRSQGALTAQVMISMKHDHHSERVCVDAPNEQ
jgi:hypothetical protein